MNSLDRHFHIQQHRRATAPSPAFCGSFLARLFIRTRRALSLCLMPFTATVEFPERWSFRSEDTAACTPPTNLERRQRWERRFAAYRSVS